MKGLLLRLSALDADAATAVRVIAHFEALLGGALDPVTLTRSTAGLAGCAAGLELPDGRTVRFAPDGAALTGAPGRVSGRVDLEPAGRVWLERPGVPGPFDELVLEWMAIAARVLAGRPRPARTPRAADPALVELVLSGREAVEDRARALRLLGLEPGTPLRVIAVAVDRGADTGAGAGTDAGVEAVALLGRGALRGTVRVARVGSLGAVLVQRRGGALGGEDAFGGEEAFGGEGTFGGRGVPGSAPDGTGAASPAAELRAAMRERARDRSTARGPAPGTRVGIGSGADPLDAHTSWAQARAALRFAVAGAPREAVADHDELGPLALLADIPVERLRAQADVRRLGRLGDPAHGEHGGSATGQVRPGGELLAALAAFCSTGSLRQAAAELHLHHSSVAARLAHVEKETGWRLRDPQDRFRAQLALYALRLAGNGDG